MQSPELRIARTARECAIRHGEVNHVAASRLDVSRFRPFEIWNAVALAPDAQSGFRTEEPRPHEVGVIIITPCGDDRR